MSPAMTLQQQGAEQEDEADAAASPQWQQHDHTRLWREFHHDYYTNDAIVAIDSAFYLIHVISTTMHRHVFGIPSQQLWFRMAVLFVAVALVLCLLFKPWYKRLRGPIVLATHITLTILRAAVFNLSSSRQAILHRGPNLVVEEDLQVGPMLISILAVTAVPMRLFEVLGLQQTCAMHAVVAVAFLALHPAAALPGARLAYSNCGFYVVHEAHDLVAAVLEGLLGAISGIPAGQQQTCSSCAGLVVYNTLFLFGSVAAPLYLAHLVEQGAFKRWCSRHLLHPSSPNDPTAAAAATLERTSSSTSQAVDRDINPAWGEDRSTHSAGSSSSGMQSRLGNAHNSSSSRSVGLRRRHPNSSSGRNEERISTFSDVITRSSSRIGLSRGAGADPSGQQDPLIGIVDAALQEQVPSTAPVGVLISMSSPYLRWCMHLLVLSAMLLGSWLLSNAFALVLLPKVLSPRQLERWCPNRPYTPYVIAGQGYEGF